MPDLDVALRLRLERSGFREGERDLKELRRAAAELGVSRGAQALGSDLDGAERKARAARTAIEALGASEARLKGATGLEAFQREAQRVGAIIGQTEARTRELKLAADRLRSSDGATVLGRELRGAQRAATASKADLQALRRAAAELGTTHGADALRQDLADVAQAADRAEKNIEESRRALQRLGREPGLDKLKRDLGEAGRRADELDRHLRRLGGSGRSRGGQQGSDFRQELADRSGAHVFLPTRFSAGGIAGLAAGAAAYGVGRGAAESVQRAMSVETAMAAVGRAMDNPTPQQLAALEAGISDLSVKTGRAKEEIASLVAEASKAGAATEDLLDIADFGQKFAIAAETTSAEAGEKLSKLRNSFGMTKDRLKEIADVINFVADKTSGTEAGILEFMNRVGATAGLVNMPARDVAAFGATFESAGAEPAVAGTGMNALLQRLGNAPSFAKDDKDFGRALRSLGTSPRQVQTDMLQDASGTIMRLLGRLQQLSEDQRLKTLAGLGGQEYADDFARLANILPQLGDALEKASSPDSKGSVEATFAAYNATSEQQVARAMSALADLGGEIGKSFVPAVRTFAQAVEWFAGGAARRMREDRAEQRIKEDVAAGRPIAPEDRKIIENSEAFDNRVRSHTLGLLRRGEAPVVSDADRMLRDEIEQLRKDLAAAEAELAALPRPRADLPFEAIPDQRAGQIEIRIQELRNAIEGMTSILQQGISSRHHPGVKAGPISYRPWAGDDGEARVWKAAYVAPDLTRPEPAAVDERATPESLQASLDNLRRSIDGLDRTMAGGGREPAGAPADGKAFGNAARVWRASLGAGDARPSARDVARYGGGGIDNSGVGSAGSTGSGVSARPSSQPGHEPSPGRSTRRVPPGAEPFLSGGYAGGAPGAEFFDAIIAAEGTAKQGNPYQEVLGYGAYGRPDKPLTEMTLTEVKKFGLSMRRAQADQGKAWNRTSSASGAFQITGSTMMHAAEALGMNPDETLFDEDTQRRMATWIAEEQGLGAWEGFKAHPGQRARATQALQARSRVVPPVVRALTGEGIAVGGTGMAALTYANRGAIRNRQVTPELFEQIQRGVTAVYGDGYRAEIYSGGQPAKGSGRRRTGTTRHDDHGHGGEAADLYVYDPDGKRVTGEELAKLGQHWAATKQGGVGLEMRGGGIHLDQHKDRARHWPYARYTAGQKRIMQQGLAGIPPQYANPRALDPAAFEEATAPYRPLPETAPLPPLRRARDEPRPGAGAGPGRSPSGPSRGPQLMVTQNFSGTDPGVQARRAQREQRRAIHMAEARALHDTQVPIA